MPDPLMRAGFAGTIIWAAAAAAIATSLIGIITIPSFTMQATLNTLILIASVIGVVGVTLVATGAYGLAKRYAQQLPVTAAVFGWAAALFLLIATVLSAALGGAALALDGEPLVIVTGMAWYVLAGVFLILLGVSLALLRFKMKMDNTALAAGVLMIIAGAIHASIIGNFFGISQFMLVPALILGMMVFYKAE